MAELFVEFLEHVCKSNLRRSKCNENLKLTEDKLNLGSSSVYTE